MPPAFCERPIRSRRPFAPCGFPRRARSCPSLSATTESDISNQTPLADFCNCQRTRAHRASDHSPRGRRLFDALRRHAGLPRPGCERHGTDPPLSGRAGWHPKMPAAPAGKPRDSIRAVAKRPTRCLPYTSCRHRTRHETWKDSRGRARRPRPASDPPRERWGSSASRGAIHHPEPARGR